MQADSRVGRRRALQFLVGQDESSRLNPLSYPTHFRCRLDPEKIKKIQSFGKYERASPKKLEANSYQMIK